MKSRKIRSFFNRYVPFFKAGMMTQITYRFSMLTWFLITMIEIAFLVFVYYGLYQNGTVPADNPLKTFQQTLSFVTFASLLTFLFQSGASFDLLANEIYDGSIFSSLIKPISYRTRTIFLSAGSNFGTSLLVILPLSVIAFMVYSSLGFIAFDSGFDMALRILLFLVELLVGYAIVDAFDFLMGTLCFYTEQAFGINFLKVDFVNFLSGATIPLAFFPDGFREVMLYSPFAQIINNPINISRRIK